MKHIRSINERRNLRDFIKYKDILRNKFKNYIRMEKIECYREDDEYYINIKTHGAAHKEFFDFLNSDIKTYDYYIMPSNGNQLTISISNIPGEYFEQLDLELDVDKYNL
jgi:hypothetical protein